MPVSTLIGIFWLYRCNRARAGLLYTDHASDSMAACFLPLSGAAVSIRQRVHHYLSARQQHPAWRLLVSPRAPLMLGCLTAVFERNS